MAHLPSELISHSRKVCSLYRRALRMLECYYIKRHEYRYEAVLLRERFDKNRNIPDARVAKELLLAGEEELFQSTHWDIRTYPESPGGIAYQRFVEPPDGVLDFWDPIEKARYPKYFAKREELKKEYVKLYEKMYKSTDKDASKTKGNA